MRILDLTQTLDEQTVLWPDSVPFVADAQAAYDVDGFWWRDLAFPEHSGTHLDAPCHCVPGGATVADIPAEQLVRPAVRIDARALCAGDPAWVLSAADVEAWEAEHGGVPAGAAVLLCTGWDEYVADPARYLSRRPARLPGLRRRRSGAAGRAPRGGARDRHPQRRRRRGCRLPRPLHVAPRWAVAPRGARRTRRCPGGRCDARGRRAAAAWRIGHAGARARAAA